MSASRNPDPATLQRAFEEEARALHAFTAVLRREQQALIEGDVEALTALSDEKGAVFGRLSTLGDQRTQLTTGLQLAGGTGIEAWLDKRPPKALERAAWKRLLQLAGEARELNRQNGQLIASRMQQHQQALTVLLAAGNPPAVYGPDGQTRSVGRGRYLGTV